MLSRFPSGGFVIAAFIYFLGISVLSHIPGQVIVEWDWNLWDKAAHAIVYAPLGLLVGMGLRSSPLFLGKSAAMLCGVLLILVLGIADEFHQSFVPGRFSSIGDVAADGIGGAVGILVGIHRVWANRWRS